MADTSQSASLSAFSVSEALSKGWQFFQKNFGALVPVGAIWLIAYAVPSVLFKQMFHDNSSMMSLLNLAMNVWSMYLSLGTTKYILSLIRGGKPEMSMIYMYSDQFINYFIMNIRVAIVVVGGLFLFIIPGLYWALKYAFTLTLVADGKADGSEAFRMSARMTEGRMIELLGYAILTGVMVGVGFIALIIPGVIAAIISGVGMMLLYDYALSHMSKKTESAPAQQ